MSNKHITFICLLISVVLIFIATSHYPGGSQNDIHSVGFNWQHNYICNLFGDTAMNGSKNHAKYWAIAGMLFLTFGFATFFFQISKKIDQKIASNIIKYCGVTSMFLAFLVVTPLHNIALNISNTLALLSIFYIVVFIFRSKRHLLLKTISVLLMTISYTTMFIYYSGYYIEYLPIMQKISFLILVGWVLGVTYYYRNQEQEKLN